MHLGVDCYTIHCLSCALLLPKCIYTTRVSSAFHSISEITALVRISSLFPWGSPLGTQRRAEALFLLCTQTLLL